MAIKNTIDEAKGKFREIIAAHQLGNEPVQVTIGTLTAEQAIGKPGRRDYALLEGKEVMIEARFKGSAGQAFTDRPHEFKGSLNEVIGLELENSEARAIFAATLNAVLAHLGTVTGVRHCRDEEPEKCAEEMAQYILTAHGKARVGQIGYQPAILENLVKVFGNGNVRCTDLNPRNIDTQKFGAEIWDGRSDTQRLIHWCDIVLATSSTIVNGTFDDISLKAAATGKKLIIFGVTGAGVSALLGLERLCFQPH